MAGLWLRVAPLVAIVSFCAAQTVEKYFKAGDTLVLSPDPVSERITSIVWKYDKNLLAEWVEGSIELTYYSKFNGRSDLNTETGVLKIRDMTAADSAVYSVEINNKVQGRLHRAVEIKEVPQPVVTVKPLACTSASASCRLICEGNVTGAEPVSYSFKKDDGEWESASTQSLEISNNEETQRVKTFSCRMKNPVSEKHSTAINNPLYQEKKPEESSGGWIAVIVGVVVVLVLIVVLVLLYFKNPSFNQCVADNILSRFSKSENTRNTESGPKNTTENTPFNLENAESSPSNDAAENEGVKNSSSNDAAENEGVKNSSSNDDAEKGHDGATTELA